MSCLQPVHPTKPVAAWIGGKRKLAKRIIKRISAVPHDTYAEAFMGMGGIFLRRDRRPKCEVINDLSDDVAIFFRVLREHGPEFAAYLKRWWITSRAEFDRLKALDPVKTQLTDFNRAARFLYLQRLAFGGKVRGQNFGISPALPARFDGSGLQPAIEAVHTRLSGVIIERLTWSDFIRRWDRAGTLFYLDPPYFGNEGDYGQDMFSREQFAAMANALAQIKGRFLLSLNDRPEVRQIFSGFQIEAVDTSYSVGGGAKVRKVGEVLISNIG